MQLYRLLLNLNVAVSFKHKQYICKIARSAAETTLEENICEWSRRPPDGKEECLGVLLADVFFVDFWEREWECMKRLWCYNGCDGCVGMRMWDPAPGPVWLSDSLETWGVTAQWKQEKRSLNTVDNEVKKRKKNVRADTLSHRAAFISSEQTCSLFVLAHAIHHKQWRASCKLPRCSLQSNNAQVTRLNIGPGPWQERLGGGGFLSALLNRGCGGGGPVSIQLLSHCVPTSTLQRRGFPSRGKIAEGRHAFFFFSLLHPFLLKKKNESVSKIVSSAMTHQRN